MSITEETKCQNCLNQELSTPGTMSVPGGTVCLTLELSPLLTICLEVVNGDNWFLDRDWSQNSYYGNNTKGATILSKSSL